MILGGLVIAMLALLILRVPVAFSMLTPCLVYVVWSPDITMGVALQQTVGSVDSFPLLAVPLFIMTGYLSNAGGLADRLFRMLLTLFKKIPGALGFVNVFSSLTFSWMSGAAIADAAGLGSVLVPAMKKRGYDEKFALGLTGASSLIGPIMPPSIPAIVYAVSAGVSVGALFFAGVLPALVLTSILCLFVYREAKRNPVPEEAGGQDMPVSKAITSALPVLLTPVIILGGILGGIFTPTEAAAAAVIWVLILSLCYRSLSFKAFRGVLVKTTSTTGSIMLIVAAAGLFGWVIAREQGPQAVTEAMLQFTDNPIVFLLLINVALLLTGMFLEPVAGLLITVPVLMPAALEFGIDPLHLGIVMILNLVLGLLTPPVGLVLYVLSSVTGSSVQTVTRGTVPFLIPLLITLLLITFIPAFSLWLPSLLVK
ncbi:Sialic acid TRAP transporter permease protein SiaT [Stieleria bergensis]|uniref:Sialic acid TRAP transporter permease protein SiaT n=1 Tax=Stieleria bergensis TaxID=2528025 RepID=A0A517T2N3_9BACT|nr:MAG: C4-dicarboxylate ABC transporter permease [Rhodopirellula sp. TMED11]QDT62591.1 Sialic acid TRAP transporter permease protein SiaT [Planctomycetes bacterium SV_7m_r]